MHDASFYSFESETWTELPPMKQGRALHQLVLIDGNPTAIGGFDSGELDSIEYFDGTNWVMREDKLKFARYGFATPDDVTEDITC